MYQLLPRALHALVGINGFVSEALVMSEPLRERFVCSSRVSNLPEERFHHRLHSFSISHSLNTHRAEAQRFTVPVSEEPPYHAIAMVDRVVRHTRKPVCTICG